MFQLSGKELVTKEDFENVILHETELNIYDRDYSLEELQEMLYQWALEGNEAQP